MKAKVEVAPHKPLLTKDERAELVVGPGGHIIYHADDGPYLAHPLTDKKGDEFMDGLKMTLGVAAVIGLVLLALGQAGVLS